MRISLALDGVELSADLGEAIDCTVPVDPTSPRVHAFGLDAPHAAPFAWRGGVLRVAEGGSVDCQQLHLYPHGAGTHVECVGHIVADATTLLDVVVPGLLVALLVDVATERLGDCGDGYDGTHGENDVVLSARAVAAGLAAANTASCATAGAGARVDAILLRTRQTALAPGHDFAGTNPPYPTREAMALLDQHLQAHGAVLLGLDQPSLDREDDGGRTSNHHRFFGLPAGATALRLAKHPQRLICELLDLARPLPAGMLLAQLDVPAIALDAAPARLRLVPLRRR